MTINDLKISFNTSESPRYARIYIFRLPLFKMALDTIKNQQRACIK